MNCFILIGRCRLHVLIARLHWFLTAPKLGPISHYLKTLINEMKLSYKTYSHLNLSMQQYNMTRNKLVTRKAPTINYSNLK